MGQWASHEVVEEVSSFAQIASDRLVDRRPVLAVGLRCGATIMPFLAKYWMKPAHQNATQDELLRRGREEEPREEEAPLPDSVWPSLLTIGEARSRLQFEENLYNIAVAGASGAGKSNFINAVRGLRNGDVGAAPTGAVETTREITRYGPLPGAKRPNCWIAWYDVPGAGTLAVPGSQYFRDQGLFIFDLIILCFDMRFTEVDIAIIRGCKEMAIPYFIVRSKADQHIDNIMGDLAYDYDNDEADEREEKRIEQRVEQAMKQFVNQTHQNVEMELRRAGLYDNQPVYIVSRKSLRMLVTGRVPDVLIGDVDLIHDVSVAARARRC